MRHRRLIWGVQRDPKIGGPGPGRHRRQDEAKRAELKAQESQRGAEWVSSTSRFLDRHLKIGSTIST